MCVCVCQECDHNLCKPDYNLTIKFKIQLVAMLVTRICFSPIVNIAIFCCCISEVSKLWPKGCFWPIDAFVPHLVQQMAYEWHFVLFYVVYVFLHTYYMYFKNLDMS